MQGTAVPDNTKGVSNAATRWAQLIAQNSGFWSSDFHTEAPESYGYNQEGQPFWCFSLKDSSGTTGWLLLLDAGDEVRLLEYGTGTPWHQRNRGEIRKKAQQTGRTVRFRGYRHLGHLLDVACFEVWQSLRQKHPIWIDLRTLEKLPVSSVRTGNDTPTAQQQQSQGEGLLEEPIRTENSLIPEPAPSMESYILSRFPRLPIYNTEINCAIASIIAYWGYHGHPSLLDRVGNIPATVRIQRELIGNTTPSDLPNLPDVPSLHRIVCVELSSEEPWFQRIRDGSPVLAYTGTRTVAVYGCHVLSGRTFAIVNDPFSRAEGPYAAQPTVQWKWFSVEPRHKNTELVTREICHHSRGQNVRSLQYRLRRLGFARVCVDGICGRQTIAAVEHLSLQWGMSAGDPISVEFLQRLAQVDHPAQYRELGPDGVGEDVGLVQQLLGMHRINGRMHRSTIKRVRSFQESIRIRPATGWVRKNTWSKLYPERTIDRSDSPTLPLN